MKIVAAEIDGFGNVAATLRDGGAAAFGDRNLRHPGAPGSELPGGLRFSDKERRRVLQKAAVLGAGLLSGEEVKP